MSDNKEQKSYFGDDDSDKDKLFVELPAEPPSPYHDQIPSGYDPMEQIYLEGRAFRGLAGGTIPWWVLITGWIIFGGFALLILIEVITSASLASLILLLIPGIFIAILWRGTNAKLSMKKHQRKRR